MKAEKEWRETSKRNAVLAAIKHVETGFVVGLGSGSTAALAIEEIGRMMKEKKLNILGVPTSSQAFLLAVRNGIPVTTLEEHPILDLAIDGADQVDDRLNMIKGLGGALTREKIIAASSKKNVIVVDQSKKVNVLGEDNHPLPIEIIPIAAPLIMRRIKEIEGKPVIREGNGKVGPTVTDNGNLIVDAVFGFIRRPDELERKLKAIPGVVETGLFLNMAHIVYVGTRSGVEKFERSGPP